MKLATLKTYLPRFSGRRDADALGRLPKTSQTPASNPIPQPQTEPLPATTPPCQDPNPVSLTVSATPTATTDPSADLNMRTKHRIGHIEKQRCPAALFQAYSLLGRIAEERPDLIGTVVPVEEMRRTYDMMALEFEWQPVTETALGIALTQLTMKDNRKIRGKRRVCYLIPNYGKRALSGMANAA